MNPFALTAEERAGAMMAPARAPDVGAFMDNIDALRAMIGGRVADGGAWLADDVAGTFDGEGGAGIIRQARSYIAEESGKTYGGILPLKKDDATGDLSFALPGFARDSITGILDMLEGKMTPEASMALLDIPVGGLLHAGVTGARQTPETLAALRAYHGSPHRYKAERLIQLPDKTTQFIEGGVGALPDVPAGAVVLRDFPAGRMRMDKIGTGEGNQAFGYGLYNAEADKVAAGYRERLSGGNSPISKEVIKNGKVIPWFELTDDERRLIPLLIDGDYDIAKIDKIIEKDYYPKAHDRLKSEARQMLRQDVQVRDPGALYTTRLDVEPEDLLDWDAPLSEQSEKVRAAWSGAMDRVETLLPSDSFNVGLRDDFIKIRSGEMKSAGLAVRVLEGSGVPADFISAALLEAGIPGIRYLDQGSRASGEGTRNFVIFDDSLISIESVE